MALSLAWRAYDWMYLLAHGLDGPAAEVGPALRVSVGRYVWTSVRLSDGALIRFGDPIGVLHLNNDRLVTLHRRGLSPAQIGIAFRRQVEASLRDLAVRALTASHYQRLAAFSTVTLFHEIAGRVGFETAGTDLVWHRLVGLYERTLVARIRPVGPPGLGRRRTRHARRVWISRAALVARYAPASRSETVANEYHRRRSPAITGPYHRRIPSAALWPGDG